MSAAFSKDHHTTSLHRVIRKVDHQCLCDVTRESTVRGSTEFHGGDGRGKTDKADAGDGGRGYRLKADGLSNGGIISASGIHEPTFWRWIGDPRTKLQRKSNEGQNRRKARSRGRYSPRSARRRSRATSTGRPPRDRTASAASRSRVTSTCASSFSSCASLSERGGA